jgi:hypothetical protein
VDTTSGCVPGDPGCISTYGLCPDVSLGLACPGGNAVVYSDAGVADGAGMLAPLNSVLSTTTGTVPDASNSLADPAFVAEYFNGSRSSVFQTEITTAIQTPAAFDEGGNYIRPSYGPLSLYDDAVSNDGDPGTLFGDYHIMNTGAAFSLGADLSGTYPALELDIDMQARPNGGAVDAGADEYYPTYPANLMNNPPETGSGQVTAETVVE